MNEIMKKESEKLFIVPSCVVSENEGTVELKIDMPGVPQGNIEVNVERNELSILGRRGTQAVEGDYLVRERRDGDFRKLFTLDENIDRDRIEASYANGVMKLTLRVREAAKPRRIEIASA
jgi:HSP20 family protein